METTHHSHGHARFSLPRVVVTIGIGILAFAGGYLARSAIQISQNTIQLVSPLGKNASLNERTNPYTPYTFAALQSLSLTPEAITIVRDMEADPAFLSFLISWTVPNISTGKRELVTGQMNIPTTQGPHPVIVMTRGYVEREQYRTGVGTKNAAAALARAGYATFAPDFLGYGGSDPESDDILIARFARPITVLQLLKNLESPSFSLHETITQSLTLSEQSRSPEYLRGFAGRLDTKRIGLWGHSNGGQITLSVLEITGKKYPTTLWAPVSQPFPYSILYYSNETPDGGAYLREKLAEFEFTLKNAPAEFSILNHPERITAPIQIHQGAKDDAVPLAWSQELEKKLQAATVSAQLFTYPQADHNLQPDWNTVMQRDIQFFARTLK